ncbi:MAG TPA: HNH endonuclease signature motif containing protein, partial [Propionicimonas sp.]|nr:HNH endonuclease signature motif containing protein [Propionicimonas sp.]
PGCTEPPAGCEAHHITPWWAGGETKLTNLVLLCHRHHALIEPARYALRDQWQVRIGVDHLPEILPPSRHPQAGQWLRHSRLCMERTAS